jgi:hypothetical protein
MEREGSIREAWHKKAEDYTRHLPGTSKQVGWSNTPVYFVPQHPRRIFVVKSHHTLLPFSTFPGEPWKDLLLC